MLRDGLVTIVSVRLLLGRYLEAEYRTDGLVFVEDLEVFVNQDDSFLQVIDELLSTPLLNKLFLELVQIRLNRLILSRQEAIKKELHQECNHHGSERPFAVKVVREGELRQEE